MTALLIAGVMATTYAGPFVGQPLYCDCGQGLTYSQHTTPWVALDVTEFQSGRVQCGDLVVVRFEDGQALDAGPLYPHVIADTGQPIAVDVPAHLAPFPGLSAQAVLSLSTHHPYLVR